jgi:hypothetical protein
MARPTVLPVDRRAVVRSLGSGGARADRERQCEANPKDCYDGFHGISGEGLD